MIALLDPFDVLSPAVSIDPCELCSDALLEGMVSEAVVFDKDEPVEFGGVSVVELPVELRSELVCAVGEGGEGEGCGDALDVRRLGLALGRKQLVAPVVADRLPGFLGGRFDGGVLVFGNADLEPVPAGVAHALGMVSHVLSIRATVLAQSEMPERRANVPGPANGSEPR